MRLPIPPSESAPLPTPPVVEGARSPETEALTIFVGTANIAAADRGDLSEADSERIRAYRPENRNTVLSGEHGAYMGIHNGAQEDAPAARTVAETLKTELEAAELDGKDEHFAIAAAMNAANAADEKVPMGQSAHAGAIRTFKGDDGKNKALLFASEGIRIIRSRLTEEEGKPDVETLIDSRLRSGSALGDTEFTRNDQIEIVDVESGDRLIMVNAHGITSRENTVLNNGYIVSQSEKAADAGDAAEVIATLPERVEEQSKGTDTPFTPVEEDISVAVIDTLAEERSRLGKAYDGVLKLAARMHLRGNEGRERRQGRYLHALRNYRENPTGANRARLIGVGTVAALGTTAGMVLAYRLGQGMHAGEGIALHGAESLPPSTGASHMVTTEATPSTVAADSFDSTNHGAGVIPSASSHGVDPSNHAPTPTHTPSHSAPASPSHSAGANHSPSATHSPSHSPSPSHPASHNASPSPSHTSASPTPHTSETTAGTNPNTGTGNQNPNVNGAFTVPEGTTVDPNHLPDNVHLSEDQVNWLKESTGSGKIGEYSDDAKLPTDGTGRPGTVWHTTLSGLKDLGYDVNKMSETDKTQYVQHVMGLDANHDMTWDQAKHLGDNHVVHNPSNADAIRTISEITAKNHGGKPLLPQEGSTAFEHMSAIKDQVEAQVPAAGTPGHMHDPTDRNPGTGSNPAPTTSPTPHTSTSPAPHPTTSAPTSHPTTAPTSHPASHTTSSPTSHPASHPTSSATGSHPATHATTSPATEPHVGGPRGGSAAATTPPHTTEFTPIPTASSSAAANVAPLINNNGEKNSVDVNWPLAGAIATMAIGTGIGAYAIRRRSAAPEYIPIEEADPRSRHPEDDEEDEILPPPRP
ncbi:MAG TPA: hypothetical protein VLF62_04420 [Candidatus Saccharimonadales bacterium]|nr:hypothetical protein [Candidatus Saccharimonadales bacterium]